MVLWKRFNICYLKPKTYFAYVFQKSESNKFQEYILVFSCWVHINFLGHILNKILKPKLFPVFYKWKVQSLLPIILNISTVFDFFPFKPCFARIYCTLLFLLLLLYNNPFFEKELGIREWNVEQCIFLLIQLFWKYQILSCFLYSWSE